MADEQKNIVKSQKEIGAKNIEKGLDSLRSPSILGMGSLESKMPSRHPEKQEGGLYGRIMIPTSSKMHNKKLVYGKKFKKIGK
ncbi:MAG: hypothetical protein NTW11_03285 [Candidatus Staskawiczbacteria bacterium]|nr:hypothetical protein [Candidatus Staskawiczbacteria bacterium]